MSHDEATLAALDRYIDEHLNESLADLTRLTAIPSVSSKGEHMDEAARYVAELLDGAGFTTQILPTEGFPVTGPTFVRLDPDDVAKLIVDVVRKGTAPEISIPRSLAALQAFRVLTPPLYRWGVGTISRRYGSSGPAEG